MLPADKHPITRRDLLRGAATGMIALAMRGDLKAAQLSSRSPNIVFVLADDLGYADVSCYGRPDLSTPNIDHIAAKGVRFLQAYANSAVCTATRTALITGRYQYRLRVGLEEPLAGNSNVGLPPEHPTLPSLLKKVGYSTTLIGKWHLGVLPKFGPLQSGYDHFYGFRGGAVDYYSHSAGRPGLVALGQSVDPSLQSFADRSSAIRHRSRIFLRSPAVPGAGTPLHHREPPTASVAH